MNTALWIVTALIALAFAAAGALKLTQPKDSLAARGLPWVEDFSSSQVKVIGALELLGAIGLIGPAVLQVATVLVPLAATGLALTMVGAGVVHLRRKEYQGIVVNVVLFALAAFVAWGRFGPYGF